MTTVSKQHPLLWSIIILLVFISAYTTYSFYSLKHQTASSLTGNAVTTLSLSSSPLLEEQSIPIVAVTNTGEGVLAHLTLRLIPGTSDILLQTNPFVEPDSQYSLNKAVAVAKLHANFSPDKDFVFSYKDTADKNPADLIGGESAGAASTVLTLATLEHKPLKKDALMTGTINADGTIGKIGGLLEKTNAAGKAGYKYFLVPDGQALYTTYKKQVTRETLKNGATLIRTQYVPQKIDLKDMAEKQWHMQVIEVKTIDDALPYFLEP